MSSTSAEITATTGSLYLAGFQQTGQPHMALILAIDKDKGYLAHMTTKQTGVWHYEFAKQNVSNSMSLTSLHCIHDATKNGALSSTTLDNVCKTIDCPGGSELGECVKWVGRALKKLVSNNVIQLSTPVETLLQEFETFTKSNQAYASRSRYPNVKY